MTDILKKLGLTREMIRRHVVSVEKPLPAYFDKCHLDYQEKNLTLNGSRPKKTQPKHQTPNTNHPANP